ncbi:hypothetical protein [Methanofollis fontis]|uniref:Uncharacterized protein n=1 Tax=Methanofollis fontis TaxID=2052832 RepID=A0A483CZ78_9EURY|nr:hypothetical protein [Methanofollis fontis]TAJ45622.1 hypothetical protein CUJ86_02560 [Methanofollis fontis]
MNRRHAGIAALILFTVAVLIGALAMAGRALVFAADYLAGTAFLAVVMIAAWCTKCQARKEGCAHALPGLIAGCLPARWQGPYTLLDHAGVLIPALIILLAPQYWLLQNPAYFVVFWALVITAALLNRRTVCPDCTNRECPLSGAKESGAPIETAAR